MSIDYEENMEGASSPNADLMRKLQTEHEHGIEFADEIIAIATHGTDVEVNNAIAKLQDYNRDELEFHLQHEEQTILGPLIQNHREHAALCIAIGKEHGYIRTLVEELHVSAPDSREKLAAFGEVLKRHTLLEDRELSPLVETLFSAQQKEAIASFVPFQRKTPVTLAETQTPRHGSPEANWIKDISAFYHNLASGDGCIVLLPRFDPEIPQQLAKHLDIGFFDFQRQVMSEFGAAADSISLQQLDESLMDRARQGSVVVHNIEALLCVKSGTERRGWLQAFLDRQWPNTVIVPIALYQGDVAELHPQVCDLELHKIARQSASGIAGEQESRLKYYGGLSGID